ncbi:putative ATPase [Pseudoloma neurophilia]|uniref:Putative ATPase n=1 Tax=Pseudoloma neurophilia TaxID=146866 RepID=A0A0R0LZI5_9MICR|nr:putative ATPase [Pseudoloma neurophilia]
MTKMLAVVSGKGGVGKSVFVSLLAARLSKNNCVLIADFDLTGPSNVFGAQGVVKKSGTGLTPLKISNNLHFLSMSSLVNEKDAVIWRTPKKLQLLEMFFNSCGSYDYVLFDTPPGITIVHKFLNSKESIKYLLVTTSQNVAVNDSINTIYFFNSNAFIGIVENMSGLKCKKCSKNNLIFSKNGGKLLSDDFKIPFLGTIEIESNLSDAIERGTLLEEIETFKAVETIDAIIEKM